MNIGVALVAITLMGLSARSDAATLQSEVDAIAITAPMNRAHLGVLAIDAATGKILAKRQADNEFAPASTFKLLLSAAALDTLGPDFRFQTLLLARGKIDQDVLGGDLILVGGGDPTLLAQDLDGAAAAAARVGIRRVSGAVLDDETLYEGRRFGPDWAWDGLPFYYEAPIQALAVDKGTVGAIITPGAHDGERVGAKLVPPAGYYTIASRAVMAANPDDDPARCSHRLGSTQILIVGRMGLDESEQTVHCAVEDTGAFAVSLFERALNSDGVVVGATPVGPRPPNIPIDVIDEGPTPPPLASRYPGASILWSHDSAPLISLMHDMLIRSDNFEAEHILKMLAVKKLNQRGSFIGGATVEQRFAVRLGIDKDALDVQDGSGLSVADRITPRGLVTILRWLSRQSYADAFISALPRAGLDGTLANRLVGTDAVGRVRAKSGYEQHTIALAGYADTVRHGRVIFAVMVGDATGDPVPFFDLEDEIVKDIVDM